MKSNRKKRVLATILCMVMVLTSSISALAEGEMIIPEPNAPVAEEPAAENIEMQQEAYTEPQVPEQPSEVIVPETTTPEVPAPEETVPETTIPEVPAPEETVPETTTPETTTPETPAPEETVPETTTPETTTPEAPDPEETVPETTTPETTEPEKTEEEKEEEPAPVFSEAVEFHQDFVDGSGNLVQRITAKLPAGAFEAETSQITMEANYVDAGMQDYIKGMMEERLPEGNGLGDYMLFDIQFKVNGEVRESLEPITLIFEKSDLEIPDTKKANVFYFDPKNPEDRADKDELIEIIQRSELIEAFQAEGRSTDTMEEDYDLSSIEMKEENRSGRIDLEGRLSTIYGCYVEKEPEKVQEETTEEKKDNETQEEAVIPQEQAPEKEGTLVEITAEETSLYRSTEEKEENIAATAKKGEQFPLLSTISIGETVWYKVQYTKPDTEETTELYVKADAAKLTDPIMELNYEDETVIIKVTAEEAGVIPKDAELKVLPITSEDAETKTQYEEVEKKIQEKVAEEEKEVAGFLAYDITFVDKDGNKMEPNGKVKVSMEYKKAELPQEVKEKKATDAEVTVLHLEEDENGEVKQVVDMAAEQKATVDTLATTEGTKVQKVEVETESFSIFTITWGNTYSIAVKYVDENGEMLSHEKFRTDNLTKELKGEVKLSDYAPTDVEINGKTYSYQKALINSVNGQEAKRVRVKKSDGIPKYQYNARETDGEWETFDQESNKRTVLLVYTVVEPLTTVGTVDASSQGVTMKMIDLSGGGTNLKNGTTTVDFGSNSGYGDGNIKYGLLESCITNNDGFPKVENSQQSLEMLFRGAQDVDHLFRQDIYNETGYFEYSSFENYAYLGNGNNFTVYNQIGTPSDEAEYFYQRGNFMPYNSIKEGQFSKNRNLYDENGTELVDGSYRYNEKLYKTQGNNNFQFGMMIDAEFTQQRDGKVTHNGTTSPMIYEFNGDDDLWVYIDNVLVLDIGGVHDAHSGSIDFSTGTVVRYDCETGGTPTPYTTTLKDIFRKANRLPNGETWTEAGAEKQFKGNTFADYTTDHSFKMYYFERGGGASNLHVKFNLPTVPKNTVNVQKVVQNENGEDVTYAEDIDFLFQIMVDNKNYANQAYDIVEGSEIVDHGTTDANAQFTLKHNQIARFNGIDGNKQYRVKEIGAYLDGYEVKIGDTTIWTPEDDKEIKEAETPNYNVDQKSTVIFINELKHSATLNITKNLAGNEQLPTDEEFQIQLRLGEQLYTGDYKIDNTTHPANDGIIKLKAGETATIIGLPYGVSFEARELLDGSYLPTYGITGENVVKIRIPGMDQDGNSNEITSASAQINGESCNLTVTNEKIPIGAGSTSVSVQKKWDESIPEGIPIPEYVDVYLYKDVNHNGELDDGDTNMGYEPVRLNASNEWSGRFEPVPGDTDYVLKEVYPPGYELIKTESDNSFDSIAKVGGRNTPNNNIVFNIGVNNLLLVKETQNKYFLWSPIDLKLDSEDISYIAGAIQQLGLEGSGNLDLSNLSYKYGVGDFNNISLDPLDNGWKLSFNGKSAWSMFWTFQYHRTQNIILTNSLDKKACTSLKVEKQWKGDDPLQRPESVTVQLYKNDQPEGDPIVLNNVNDWKHTFENLPIYTTEGSSTIKNVYTVKEIKIDSENVDENGRAKGYQSSVTETVDEDGITKFVITNVKDWQIIKISENSKDVKLPNAIFKLTKEDLTYWGKSDEGKDGNGVGVVKWYKDSTCREPYNGVLKDGTYILKEIKSPECYAVSGEEWTINISNGSVGNITSSISGKKIIRDKVDGKETFYFENTPLYDLPSTGGPGIFVYTIGGTLLLMAASLLLYKMKREGVLKG